MDCVEKYFGIILSLCFEGFNFYEILIFLRVSLFSQKF